MYIFTHPHCSWDTTKWRLGIPGNHWAVGLISARSWTPTPWEPTCLDPNSHTSPEDGLGVPHSCMKKPSHFREITLYLFWWWLLVLSPYWENFKTRHSFHSYCLAKPHESLSTRLCVVIATVAVGGSSEGFVISALQGGRWQSRIYTPGSSWTRERNCPLKGPPTSPRHTHATVSHGFLELRKESSSPLIFISLTTETTAFITCQV